MSKSNATEIPGSTLGGAADKFAVERVDGRFVFVELPGTLHIPSRPAPDMDPAKRSEFKNEAGPPSIVQILISSSPKFSDDEISKRRLAMKKR